MTELSFGKLIKKLRTEKGLTQQDVADNIGVKQSTLAGYEAEVKQGMRPAPETLRPLAKVLGCNLTVLQKAYDNIPDTSRGHGTASKLREIVQKHLGPLPDDKALKKIDEALAALIIKKDKII